METAEASKRFHELVWPLRAGVLRAARIQTGNLAEAEDLAQDTLIKAFKAIASFQFGTDPKAWLLAILRNARIDWLRKNSNSKQNVSVDGLIDEPAAGVLQERLSEDAWADPAEMLSMFSDAQVIEALQTVSEDLRWTLLLVDVEELDHRDAAKILGVPIGTVKSRIHRGRAVLYRALLPLARDRRLVRD